MSVSRPPLLVILGPTATGKTDVAIEIALFTGGEVISADSMLIYKYMDIGTAKPGLEERKDVIHHLIDVVSPSEDFSVARYQAMAREAINNIYIKRKLPILAGGTGLYITSLVDGFKFSEVGIDYKLRENLNEFAIKRGKESLHYRLKKVDPKTAERLHPNDQKRIIRALEIYEKTGRPLSSFDTQWGRGSEYEFQMFGLYMSREKLYQKINDRVDMMIKKGLVEEVRELLDMGYATDLISMQGLGYKEIAGYLRGDIELGRAVELLKRNTRRFAKRQFTWFRRDKRIQWINVSEYSDAQEIAREIVGKLPEKWEEIL